MKLSRQAKEIIQIVVFLVVVGTLVFFYAIYPLTRTKAAMGRPDIENYVEDSLVTNDPALFAEAGLPFDTFRVDADGLTNLACMYIEAQPDTGASPRGTVCLLHDDGETRDSMLTLSQLFHDSGYAVIAYDQRASGRSTGRYRGEGAYEAADLEEVIRYLDLREKIPHPFIVIGYATGGDAAILAAQEEERIDGVAAVKPYLTTNRWLDKLKAQHDMLWFPFFRTMMWWWYDIRSSYAAPYREIDDIEPVASPTLVFLPEDSYQDPEIEKLQEISGSDLLPLIRLPDSDWELFKWVTGSFPSNRDTIPN